MRYYKVRMRSEYEVIVRAENIAEAHKGHGEVIECVATGLNHEIVNAQGPITRDEYAGVSDAGKQGSGFAG